jgi:hypothetical protein
LKNYYIILYNDGLQMPNYSEDEVRNAAELREWLIKQISDREDELEKMRTILSLIDNLLKHGSFKAASNLNPLYSISPVAPILKNTSMNLPDPIERSKVKTEPRPDATQSFHDASQQTGITESKEVRQLKRLKDNLLLANAEISQNTVQISPTEGIELNINTPPFKSFFLNRILDGMKTKDAEKVNQGQIKESESMNYQVEDSNGLIKRIIITNCRESERLTEIFNTSTWVFSRMMEKEGK